MSNEIRVSQKLEHSASGAYFEKDSDGDIILCDYIFTELETGSLKEFLRLVLQELGDSDASAAPEQREATPALREQRLEPYEERCKTISCESCGGECLEAVGPSSFSNECVSIRISDEESNRYSVWLRDAEQWASFANEVFALLGSDFVCARKVGGVP